MKLTSEQRDQVADDAATRYRAGETWAKIAERYGLTSTYVRRLTVARHDISFRRWGQQPLADIDEVVRRREDGQTLNQIAEKLGCSRQAIRTALETAQRAPETRYPRLSQRRAPTEDEINDIQRLYEVCPQAPRNREGSRAVRGPEGRLLAEACRTVVDDGVPMQTLSVALGRGATWTHWLLNIHDLRPEPDPVRTTARRTRRPNEPEFSDSAV
ncbi:helix-turn-helix domain-containing protein [Brachybacterium sacelli]|uniref:DNA invertase Pin-like site-specific DNA recombinase n=1 Tax=Brachybacterium sacelli TaxID=173364 RepID=A0ABS4X2Y8_9MICO|nr:helix-turn-helix domain-containing protein [Brachybacterium sacelli]MBP2382815.1 DNA invertase Pin-like site-specific DNA recombinase [Brachybacterium sacelli]